MGCGEPWRPSTREISADNQHHRSPRSTQRRSSCSPYSGDPPSSAAKAALRAAPAARSAKLEAINAPIIQRQRLSSLSAVAADLAAQHGRKHAECVQAAVQIVLKAAAKRAGGKTYPANGAGECARRKRQLAKAA